MALDWGDDRKPEITWPLVRRVFGYFAPYWRYAVLAIACIAAGAGLGLVPALVTKALIDYLRTPEARAAIKAAGMNPG